MSLFNSQYIVLPCQDPYTQEKNLQESDFAANSAIQKLK